MPQHSRSSLQSAINEAVAFKAAAAEPEPPPAAEAPPRPPEEPPQASPELQSAIHEAWVDRVVTARKKAAAEQGGDKGLRWANHIPVQQLTGSYRREAQAAARRLRFTLIAIVVTVVLLTAGLWLSNAATEPAPTPTATLDKAAADAFPPRHPEHGR